MHRYLRGVLAALALSAVGAGSAGAATLAPGETVLPNGLTVAIRRATASPTVSLQVWFNCPSDGYEGTQPGIARLAALAVLDQKAGGSSFRDDVRSYGGQISVAIFPEATQFWINVPAYVAEPMQSLLLERTFKPAFDEAGFRAARDRLAEQQTLAQSAPDSLLRDGLLAALFSSGPRRSSTYGTSQGLRAIGLPEVRAFATKAFAVGNAIVVAAGVLDAEQLRRRVEKTVLPTGSPAPVRASVPATTLPDAAVPLLSQAAVPGTAIGWTGPSIDDELSSTAMDFISDYLTRPDYGLVFRAVHDLNPSASFNGQFITLQHQGVFYVSASGPGLDPVATQQAIRKGMERVVSGPLPKAEFARALDAFRTHMLRDTQTPQEIADNYGWYFSQGAPAYSPSARQVGLDGDYFARISSLTPRIVVDVARRYLAGHAAIVTLVPHSGDQKKEVTVKRGLRSPERSTYTDRRLLGARQ